MRSIARLAARDGAGRRAPCAARRIGGEIQPPDIHKTTPAADAHFAPHAAAALRIDGAAVHDCQDDRIALGRDRAACDCRRRRAPDRPSPLAKIPRADPPPEPAKNASSNCPLRRPAHLAATIACRPQMWIPVLRPTPRCPIDRALFSGGIASFYLGDAQLRQRNGMASPLRILVFDSGLGGLTVFAEDRTAAAGCSLYLRRR